MSNIERMQDLVNTLNYHTRLYDAGKQEISDKKWDEMYFELKSLEDELAALKI